MVKETITAEIYAAIDRVIQAWEKDDAKISAALFNALEHLAMVLPKEDPENRGRETE